MVLLAGWCSARGAGALCIRSPVLHYRSMVEHRIHCSGATQLCHRAGVLYAFADRAKSIDLQISKVAFGTGANPQGYRAFTVSELQVMNDQAWLRRLPEEE